MNHIIESSENDRILAEMLAHEVEQARKRQRGPSAEELAEMPVERVVWR